MKTKLSLVSLVFVVLFGATGCLFQTPIPAPFPQPSPPTTSPRPPVPATPSVGLIQVNTPQAGYLKVKYGLSALNGGL